jgi:hypothetical protein
MKVSRSCWLVLALFCAHQTIALAETFGQPAPTEHKNTDKQAAKQAVKKEPGVMEKTGQSAKSGWHKFTKSVKQGNKKPPCTQAEKSMNHCK